jgi:hypothetical protein
VDVSAYTVDLQWIGCATDGCDPSQFFCQDDGTTLYFGTTGTSASDAMRALLGDGSEWPQTYQSCCGPTDPKSICNSPDDQESVTALCQQLGYAQGTFVWSQASNFCPEPHFDGTSWTNEWNSDYGFGQTYTCSNGDLRAPATTAEPVFCCGNPNRRTNKKCKRKTTQKKCESERDNLDCFWVPCSEVVDEEGEYWIAGDSDKSVLMQMYQISQGNIWLFGIAAFVLILIAVKYFCFNGRAGYKRIDDAADDDTITPLIPKYT